MLIKNDSYRLCWCCVEISKVFGFWSQGVEVKRRKCDEVDLDLVFSFSLSCEGVATLCVWCMLRCAGVSVDYGLSKE